MRILIVDDEVVALNSVRRLLKRRGFSNVEICDNGMDAISRIKNKDFDIVLLDLLMPEVDGFKVLESSKPFKPQTEFILVTAVDDIATAVKAVRHGAYDYLVKPVDNERQLTIILLNPWITNVSFYPLNGPTNIKVFLPAWPERAPEAGQLQYLRPSPTLSPSAPGWRSCFPMQRSWPVAVTLS
jgi:CheY-like chemotaxis protein